MKHCEKLAANSVYDFLIDLMKMERAIGNFDFFMDEAEREVFIKRMKAYFDKAGVKTEY